MHALTATTTALLFALAASNAAATQDAPPPAKPANLAGLHDFDFLVGDWRVSHRKLRERLANSDDWVEFDGTITVRKLMDGWGNVGDNVFNLPDGAYRGASLRAYDPQTGQWASWWLDGRNPAGNLDPPIRGAFAGGVGTFWADDTLRGKPVRVRTTWSRITSTSARWEQAYSGDGGKTWEVNWTSNFQRAER
jgi:hypothetical protein